ncbi:CMGC family protein kinase [Trichomonas vaginalis G3]|uniref:CMGC family protein kinase n=1 Tax=Trichomonas vaginalis (strain ATCC PRA-98 / G3) TaxID=412133 RepID=A2FM10_TRIV3|nr:cyclin-dependent protein serine/threonine kinase protein [Trichomonas vaginalis G3]EAX94051.1 CMGC family protein kinase [Trichomonas vaginalis G3]KAI5548219.1 cyclin-dependent protein serine/threonine kinase protein [Trichomonas vaginalis G3]|eukprot:XP_001306981.1 CMGC family protein kinase [Trichomonas vaginalis G3]
MLSGPKRYEKTTDLQQGTFGIVYLCKDLLTKKTVVCKESDIDEISAQEIETLKSLKHPNIIQMLDSFKDFMSEFIIMEYGGKDLLQILEDNPKMDIKEIKYITREVLKGVEYIHSMGYIHRDLKSSNILVSETNEIKIIDFGYCRKIKGRPLTPCRFTNQFAPLDCLLGFIDYNEKMDIWGVGCILGHMLAGKLLFEGDSQISVLMNILQVLGTPKAEDWPEMKSIEYFESFQLPEYKSTLDTILPKDVDPQAVDLLLKMLEPSQSKRISAHEALQHPFLAE